MPEKGKLPQDLLLLTLPVVLESLNERVLPFEYSYRATSALAPSEKLVSVSHQLIAIA